jgi:hypothetical protein
MFEICLKFSPQKTTVKYNNDTACLSKKSSLSNFDASNFFFSFREFFFTCIFELFKQRFFENSLGIFDDFFLYVERFC